MVVALSLLTKILSSGSRVFSIEPEGIQNAWKAKVRTSELNTNATMRIIPTSRAALHRIREVDDSGAFSSGNVTSWIHSLTLVVAVGRFQVLKGDANW